VPAVAVPVLFDQPFWSARLHQLGVAPAPLPQRDLTADALAGAIRACLDEPAYRSRAATLADRIRVEDGAAGVLAVVNSLDSRYRTTQLDVESTSRRRNVGKRPAPKS
jgi:UDP:flavonoid glycosyltransferase YjiC (YdhE family)